MRKVDPAHVEEQRERIMRAALKCFARKGVHGTTTDDIAAAAKVSPGKLYYYFKSRDGLIHDLIAYAHAARDHFLRDLSDAPDLLKALIDIQTSSAKAIAARGVPVEVYLELLAYSTRHAGARQAFKEAADQVTAIVAQAVHAHQLDGKLRSDISADALAQFISASVMGMSIAELSQGAGSQAQVQDALVRMVSAGADS